MPSVYAIAPASMLSSGGPAVITGPAGLASTTGVDVGVSHAPSFAAASDTTLYVTCPAVNAGLAAVIVHTDDLGDISIPGGLTYTAAPTVVDWPTLPEVRAFLRVTGTTDDPVIDSARAAAVDYGNRRTGYRWSPGASASWLSPMPGSVHQAALIHAARLYRRRDSIDGTVGWADVGLTHIGRVDSDVEALYSAAGPLVFA